MRRERWRRSRARVALLLIALLRRLVRPLGWRGAQRMGAALGLLAWPLARRDRRRTLEHLAIAFPELSPRERRALGRRSFAHFGTMLLECLRLLGSDCAEVRRVARIEGWEELAALRAAGRETMLVTGHCGNWELLAAAVSCHGVPASGAPSASQTRVPASGAPSASDTRVPLVVVAREAQERELDAAIVGLRARFGTRTITRGSSGAGRELLRTLRGDGVLGMLIDQDTRVEGVFVPFFGRAAWTPSGAAEIGLKRGIAVLPTFIERLADGTHLVRLLPAVELGDDVTTATARLTATIEAQVRRVPAQWVWMHRRWRTRPPAPPVVEASA